MYSFRLHALGSAAVSRQIGPKHLQVADANSVFHMPSIQQDAKQKLKRGPNDLVNQIMSVQTQRLHYSFVVFIVKACKKLLQL
ncbi:hypothetical protein B9Z55_026393 [Caenorhabditis nigoni]|uniref:Uncharacterized protein n=1 Tax=Caenorhabditis nigoni TaxID=1611254 RepID=A0A2G5T2W6_9PELO|nr:hypothetical protein B9Z55_026393 [Caenorhabditis nigoni]